MRRHWPIEELHAHWTLLPEEKHLALAKRGALRLGFAVLLKFFHYEGRFPNEPREVPAVAVAYVAEQLALDAQPQISAFFIFAPEGTALADLALAAGARWAIERCFQESKSQLGLDQYEVRTWHGWYRHITLVMAAYAFLITLRRQQLKKNLSLSLGGQCLKPFPWLNCDDGSL